jgi:hypothetical protein
VTYLVGRALIFQLYPGAEKWERYTKIYCGIYLASCQQLGVRIVDQDIDVSQPNLGNKKSPFYGWVERLAHSGDYRYL